MHKNNENKVYQDDIAVIYHNDYTDIVENLNFDLIITDPPYNIGHKYIDGTFNDKKSEEVYRKLFLPLKDKKVVFNYMRNHGSDKLETTAKNVLDLLGSQSIVTILDPNQLGPEFQKEEAAI